MTTAAALTRHTFLWRRLHSLTGVLPVGLFLLEHFFTNSFGAQGSEIYNAKVEFFMGLPYILLIEIAFIWIPLFFHGAYGTYLIFTGESSVGRYAYLQNWMYLLQRITGIITFIFIIYHVYTTRIVGLFEGRHASFEMMHEALQNPAILAFYIAGIASASFHLGNGLFGFALHWGVTIGDRSQRSMIALSWVAALVMIVFGLNALRGFV